MNLCKKKTTIKYICDFTQNNDQYKCQYYQGNKKGLCKFSSADNHFFVCSNSKATKEFKLRIRKDIEFAKKYKDKTKEELLILREALIISTDLLVKTRYEIGAMRAIFADPKQIKKITKEKELFLKEQLAEINFLDKLIIGE